MSVSLLLLSGVLQKIMLIFIRFRITKPKGRYFLAGGPALKVLEVAKAAANVP